VPAGGTLPPQPRRWSRSRPLIFAVIISAIVLLAGIAAAYLEAVAVWTRESNDITSMARLADDPDSLVDGQRSMQLSNYVVATTQIVKHGAEGGSAGCIDRLVDRVGVLLGPNAATNPAIETLCEQKQTVGHIVNESPRLVVLRPRFDERGDHIATEVTVVETEPRPDVLDAALAPSVVVALVALTLIAGLATYLVTVRNQRRYAALWEAASVDGLTGCVRREVFLGTLAGAVAEARSAGGRLSVLVLDLDDLKAINDRHGHAAGDTAIRHVASELRRGLRTNDIVGRLGGDEFAALMTGAPLAEAITAAERVRAAIAATREGADAGVAVTVSIGVAELGAEETAEALMDRADAALYAAKEADRNRVAPSPG
jgi:diguanylate cyclase (GGDEF)-like protein